MSGTDLEQEIADSGEASQDEAAALARRIVGEVPAEKQAALLKRLERISGVSMDVLRAAVSMQANAGRIGK